MLPRTGETSLRNRARQRCTGARLTSRIYRSPLTRWSVIPSCYTRSCAPRKKVTRWRQFWKLQLVLVSKSGLRRLAFGPGACKNLCDDDGSSGRIDSGEIVDGLDTAHGSRRNGSPAPRGCVRRPGGAAQLARAASAAIASDGGSAPRLQTLGPVGRLRRGPGK
jgi:hypothetical protein